jgi:hypothetical protein
MKTIATSGLVLCLALAPSVVRAEMSADDRVFATALEARLRGLDVQKQNCGRGVRIANIQAGSVLDRTERRSYGDTRGGLTSQEKISSPVDDARSCERAIEAERSTLQAVLADPDRLHYESERLRVDLREELLSLLMDVRAASVVLNAQSSYEEFALRMGAIGNRLTLIRYRYHIALSRGDHKALGVPVSEACNALYAAAGEWKQAHRAAREVASAQAAVSRALPWQADYFQRQVREAQLKHTQAQRRLTDNTTTALTLVHNATRVARHGESAQASALSRSR